MYSALQMGGVFGNLEGISRATTVPGEVAVVVRMFVTEPHRYERGLEPAVEVSGGLGLLVPGHQTSASNPIAASRPV